MRKTLATRERSKLQRLSQACFYLLIPERENTRDCALSNCTLGEREVQVCHVVNTFELWLSHATAVESKARYQWTQFFATGKKVRLPRKFFHHQYQGLLLKR